MRRALVVGLNEYPGAPLSGAVNDAHAIAGVFEAHGNGDPNFGVKVITAPGTIVTRALLREAITDLFKGPSDIALLYFSGHGMMKSTGGYILTPDYKKYDEGISMDEILIMANQSEATEKIIVLDCCHSGAFGVPAIMGQAHAQLSEGMCVLTASRDSEAALEINGCGLFTSLVVSALQGGAADLRGHITPGSVYAYVDQALGAWDQRPIFKTNVARFVSLRTVAPAIPLQTLRKLCTYFPTPHDEFALDPSYEDSSPAPNAERVVKFKDLQKMQSVALVRPVDEEYMYFAAMNSRSCRLTALGYHYWRLVNEKKI